MHEHLLRTARYARSHPLLLLAGLFAVGLAAESLGDLDPTVLAYLGNNPGNQGR